MVVTVITAVIVDIELIELIKLSLGSLTLQLHIAHFRRLILNSVERFGKHN